MLDSLDCFDVWVHGLPPRAAYHIAGYHHDLVWGVQRLDVPKNEAKRECGLSVAGATYETTQDDVVLKAELQDLQCDGLDLAPPCSRVHERGVTCTAPCTPPSHPVMFRITCSTVLQSARSQSLARYSDLPYSQVQGAPPCYKVHGDPSTILPVHTRALYTRLGTEDLAQVQNQWEHDLIGEILEDFRKLRPAIEDVEFCNGFIGTGPMEECASERNTPQHRPGENPTYHLHVEWSIIGIWQAFRGTNTGVKAASSIVSRGSGYSLSKRCYGTPVTLWNARRPSGAQKKKKGEGAEGRLLVGSLLARKDNYALDAE
ncbi:hypothetical protein EJ05DRAFT_515648 [Pseudovirgaria hyperparasitica]|uniref:Uncharacterized protein n=1 Tax=Pseudovirgaria hyperparasitica TaxID=470096 RepID=A0A6A6VP88_9PEZI|nr:uncharacterized protein EJ05DRAFT_515648 [Pseudovirgaria hyperparasitica]KAF2752438.1 hypothetical protein EJ05DRAFT_515648 [Pseudovirgaria hyperparasitica]